MTARVRSAFAASTGFVAAVTPPKPRATAAKEATRRAPLSRTTPYLAASLLRDAA